MQSKAVFFDRDDTLIIDSDYMHKIADFKLYDDTISALKEISKKGYKLFIITNQSGIGRGYFTIEQMHEFNNHMLSVFQEHDIKFEALAYCPHAPEDNCDCRKPSPKLINELVESHKIDSRLSYMIGDKLSDAKAGKNANMTGVLLRKESDEFKSFDSLTEFANFLE